MANTESLLDCRPLRVRLLCSMTSRDTDLSESPHHINIERHKYIPTNQNSNHTASTMSATSIYPPYYPPSTVSPFNHPPASNPRPYQRSSQPSVQVYSNQCTPVPPVGYPFPEQQLTNESHSQKGEIGPPLPHTSTPQYSSGGNQPMRLRTANPNAPMTRTLSQPRPRIITQTKSIDPSIHLDIVHHPLSEIVAMLAAKLQNLITTNDRLKLSTTTGTAFPSSTSTTTKPDTRLLSFHARNIPSITITAYLNRILKYCPTDPEVFISVLVYFDRILRIANSQTQPIFGEYYTSYKVVNTHPLVHSPLTPTHDDDSFTIDSFNVHRLVITTIAVATKFFSDQFYTNSRYARVLSFLS